jgi:ribosomal protein S3
MVSAANTTVTTVNATCTLDVLISTQSVDKSGNHSEIVATTSNSLFKRQATYTKMMNTMVGAVMSANTRGMQPQSGPTTQAVGHSVA